MYVQIIASYVKIKCMMLLFRASNYDNFFFFVDSIHKLHVIFCLLFYPYIACMLLIIADSIHKLKFISLHRNISTFMGD